MANILKGFYPNFKIHKICANDDLRPAMGYVFFKYGNAYATNSHVAISAPLSTISNFTDEEKKLLDSKVVHATQFAKLLTMRNVNIELVGEKLCFYCTTKAGETVIIPLLDEYKIGKFPNIENVITQAELKAKEDKEPINCVGLNACLMADLSSAMYADIMHFYFGQKKGAIVVRGYIYTEIRAIIMPCLIEEPEF